MYYLQITENLRMALTAIAMAAIRAQGAGGQNMNKLASAIYLHFNIGVSSLPATDKKRLLKLNDQRIAKDGSVIIKAQSHRTQNQT